MVFEGTCGIRDLDTARFDKADSLFCQAVQAVIITVSRFADTSRRDHHHSHQLMHTIGRTLQIMALIVPIFALIRWSEPVYLFAALVFSVCLFGIGRIIEGYANP